MNCTSRYNVLHQKKMWAGENRKCVSCVLKIPKCRSVIKTLLRDFHHDFHHDSNYMWWNTRKCVEKRFSALCAVSRSS